VGQACNLQRVGNPPGTARTQPDQRRLKTGEQDTILPHKSGSACSGFGTKSASLEVQQQRETDEPRHESGQAIGNPDLELEGQAENLGGKVQKKVGQVEQVFEK